METLLIILLILYNVGFGVYILYVLKSPNKKIDKLEEEPREATVDDNIVGKSKFKMQKKVPQAAKSMPLGATREKGEDIADMPTTFASQTPDERSQRVADEDMDSAFEDIRMETTPTSYGDNDDDYDGVPNEAFASGSTFEEIGESMEVANDPDATESQKAKAGKVFIEMEGTELYDKLMENSSKWRSKIKALTDSYLGSTTGDSTRESNRRRKEFKPPTTLDKFNIRDYV